MARGRGSGKKSGSKPTTSRRAHRQDVIEQYSKLREEAQLLGIIPTTPEGAVKKGEAVPPSADPPDPNMVTAAIRQGWAVPEERKPQLVDELIKIATAISDESGEGGIPAKVKVAAFNALRQADQAQYEKDHPELMAKIKGGKTQVAVNVQNNTSVQVGEVFDDISALEHSIGMILCETEHTATGDLRADGDEESVDAEESDITEEEPETD